MNLRDIYERAAVWNSLRYEQEYNHQLAASLFFEELIEFYDAEETVEQVDAMCDMVFVAMGILWKLKPDEEQLEVAMQEGMQVAAKLVDTGAFAPIFHVSSAFSAFQHDDNVPLGGGIATCIFLIMSQFASMGFDADKTMEALIIVCNSNDTKRVERVSSDVKASKDKGTYFVPPEPKLKKLLERLNESLH